jgi:REP element-mobilizing transposase RayT
MKKTHNKYDSPYAYFITFTCYGTWLHFNKRLSVDPKHNVYGTRRIEFNNLLFEKKKNKLHHEPFVMNHAQRRNVLQTILSVCEYCHWRLFAANVRSNHLHMVIQSEQSKEYVMTKIKAYASRNLNILNPENKNRQYWTRHGSTIPVCSKDYFYFLMDYVVNGQGKNIACYYEKWFDDFAENGLIPDVVSPGVVIH